MALALVSSCDNYITSSRTNMAIMVVRILSCLPVDFSENCTFQPLQLNKVCTMNFRGKNERFENDTVPGVVSIVQENTSFCNQTEKEVTIYKREWCLEMHVYFCIEMI